MKQEAEHGVAQAEKLDSRQAGKRGRGSINGGYVSDWGKRVPRFSAWLNPFRQHHGQQMPLLLSEVSFHI